MPGQQIQTLAVSVRARAKELLGEATAFPEDGYQASTSGACACAT